MLACHALHGAVSSLSYSLTFFSSLTNAECEMPRPPKYTIGYIKGDFKVIDFKVNTRGHHVPVLPSRFPGKPTGQRQRGRKKRGGEGGGVSRKLKREEKRGRPLF